MAVSAWPTITLILVVAFFVQSARPVNHDIAYYFFIGRGILSQSVVLYRDYIDPNFPLASFSMIPAVWVNEHTRLNPQQAITVYVLAIALLSFMLTRAAARKFQLNPVQNFAWQAALIAGYCFIPGYEFGQREHLIAMLLVPYVVTAASRSKGMSLPFGLAFAIGAGAGIGIGIKPFAGLIVLAVEIAILSRRRRLRAILRPETVAIALVLIAVISDLFLIHWRYFGIARWLVAFYPAYDNWPMVVSTAAIFTVLFIITRGLTPQPDMRVPILMELDRVATAGAIGAMAEFIVQMKGWPYHVLPLAYLLFLVAGLCLLQMPLKLRDLRSWIALLALLMIGAGFPTTLGASPATDDLTALERRIDQSKGPFYVLSTSGSPSFQLAVATGHSWASRFPMLIMLPELAAAHGDPKVAHWETWFRNAIAQDLKSHRPTLVFVPLFQDQAMPAGFDVLGWFKQDPGFRREWQSYEAAGVAGNYAVFQRSRMPQADSSEAR